MSDWTPADPCTFDAWERLGSVLNSAGVHGIPQRLRVMRAIIDNPIPVLAALGYPERNDALQQAKLALQHASQFLDGDALELAASAYVAVSRLLRDD